MDNDYFLPLLVFGVQQPQLAGFIEHLEHSQTIADGDSFYSLYGVRRTNPEIGEYYDWFTEKYCNEQPGNLGLFDMNSYENL
jgi:hypothetical protein